MSLRRPVRLPRFTYIGQFGYSLRFGTFQRRSHFTDPALIRSALVQIERTGSDEQFALIAYCFMPDHVHLAIRGLAAESNLRRFVKIAKQRVAYLARRQFAIPALWQDGYYERVVRAYGMASVVRYILDNPVQAGLVQRRDQYPFSGSFCD